MTELTAAALPAVGGRIGVALQETSRNPSWIVVADQLRLLRTASFFGLYIRRDRSDIELVPIYAWSGNVTQELVEGTLDLVYAVVRQLHGLLGKPQMSRTVTSALEEGKAQITSSVLSLVIDAFIDFNSSTEPQNTMLILDTDGVTPELRSRLDSGAIERVNINPLSIGNRPTAYAAVVDGKAATVHGYNDIFSFDLPELSRNFGYLVRYG